MLTYTLHSIQGKRFYQEDRVVLNQNLGYITAAVIDGHGGDNTAEYIKNFIIKYPTELYPEYFKKIHKGVIEEGYKDGACLMVCDIFKESGTFGIAWVGDCIAYRQTQEGITQLNEIHGVFNKKEIERITKQIGKEPIISGPYLIEDWRTGNGLMPTRAIGDPSFTRVGVICEPEVITGKLNRGESLILITDGADNLNKDELEGTATDIVLRAYDKGSSDNISAIKITFE